MKFARFHLMMAAFKNQNHTYDFIDTYFEGWDIVLQTLNYSEENLLRDIENNWDLTDSKNIVTSSVVN